MIKVFISYNHADKFAAQILEEWAKNGGYSPLRDETEFRPGNISEEIQRTIKDCDLFCVVLSKNYYESEWTIDELGQARAQRKDVLFVSVDGTIPKGPDKNIKPLELAKIPTSGWERAFISTLSLFLEKQQIAKPDFENSLRKKYPKLSDTEIQSVLTKFDELLTERFEASENLSFVKMNKDGSLDLTIFGTELVEKQTKGN